MKTSLLSFKSGLNSLRQHIDLLELESKLLSSIPDDGAEPTGNPDPLLLKLRELVSNPVNKRRFDYNSIIVSLYGYLEQYIESLLKAYIRYLNSFIPCYSQFPKPIADNHVALSFNLITKIAQTRYRGTLSKEQIISNLHSCISGSDKYKLNLDAFGLHTANFRSEVIREFFAKIGVSDVMRRLLDNDLFIAYIERTYPHETVEKMMGEGKEALFFYHLDDLAERRNDVSHGVSSQMLSNEILLSYIDFFDVFGPSIYEVVRMNAFAHEVEHLGVKIGSPIAVYDNSIVCLCMKGTQIQSGDWLIAETGNASTPFLGCEINEIEVNHVRVKSVEAQPSIDIGIKVEYKAKNTHSFYLVPSQ